jgi:hypothetical protein
LISALHAVNQRQLRITLVGAGLPQLLGQMGRAKSYAERLFEFVPIGPLEPEAAREALCIPAEQGGVQLEDAAVEEIITRTQGYPYFLQEWGKHAWSEADASPITHEDALRAMAELGPGPHRSGDIAALLGKKPSAVAPVRSRLIGKGMAYSPAHGDTAFTVPLFDGFLRRTIPESS